MKFALNEFIKHLQELEAKYSISNASIAVQTENGLSHETDIQIDIAKSLNGDTRLIISPSWSMPNI